MRLDQLTPAHVRRAVEIYLREAWPPGAGGEPRITVADLEGASTLQGLLERFELAAEPGASRSKRYTLRLGNCRYPFMKFVVQEYLVNGEYFFSVDTHDRLEIRHDAPDYAEWEQLKEWNRQLKERIEARWNEAGLPTHADLRSLVEELARVERGHEPRARLLLVDDETDVALGLQALLRAQGYDVELAHSGRAVLERLGRDPLPDLVLLDYELPELDGEEVLARMRADPRLADVAVLMATASSIDLARLQRISGFLRKPYPRDVLFAMISRLLAERRKRPEPGPGA